MPFKTMAKKKKSNNLGEQLAELANVRPVDYDPETLNGRSDGDDGSDSDAREAREHYLSVGKGKIRQELELELEDPKYDGQKVSRDKILNGASSDDVDLDPFDQGDEESEEMGSFSDEGSVDEEGSATFSQTGSDQDEDSDAQGNSNDEEEDEQSANGDTLDPSSVQAELQELQKEEKNMMHSLSSMSKGDIAKGQAVQSQMMIWEGLLDTRIRMQKVVELANRLPAPESRDSFVAEAKDKCLDLESELQNASQQVYRFLNEILSLRETLWQSNPTIKVELKKRKRSASFGKEVDLDGLWADVRSLDTSFLPFRNETIDKWNQKVQVASGTASLQKKFKVINQSVLSQIQHILNDKDRLIKRSQLKRSEYKIFGSNGSELSGPNEESKGDAHLSEYHSEIYDDDDFYQELLKELIESRMADTDDPVLLGLKRAALKQQQKSKKRRGVDQRASKGRKIRYSVQEKIQNYMAPEPRGSWHSEMSEELFAALFGQHEEHLQESADSKGDLKLGPRDDGFKIL